MPGRHSATSSSSNDPADVEKVDTGRTVPGARCAAIRSRQRGFTRLMQTEGEVAGRPCGGPRRYPVSLSTLGASSIEDVSREPRTAAIGSSSTSGKTATGRSRWWSGPPGRADTLLVTVDVPVAGAPAARHPQRHVDPAGAARFRHVRRVPRPMVVDLLTTEPLSVRLARTAGRARLRLLDAMFNPTSTLKTGVDQDAIAEQSWSRNSDVGRCQAAVDIASTACCCRTTAAGQLDRAPYRPPPADGRGRLGGATNCWTPGSCPAPTSSPRSRFGARFTLVGRAYLYGLIAVAKRYRPGDRDPVRQVTRTMRTWRDPSLDE